MSPRLQKFCRFYASFSKDSLERLDEFYDEQSVLKDPVHEIKGLESISTYFLQQCQDLKLCQFEFHSHVESGDKVFLRWTMHYAHPRIKGGKTLSLEGASEVYFVDDKVRFHCDFYDMGAMVYEHLPLIGGIIRFIRTRLSKG